MARADRNWVLGERVGIGPHGWLFDATAPGGHTALVELATDDAADSALARRAERAGALRHPFVLRVWGCQTLQGRTALVLEHAVGVDLAELGSAGPVPHDAAIDLFRKAARALHAGYDRKPARGKAHGLVHGALEPRDLRLGADGAFRLHGLGMVTPAGQDGGADLPPAVASPWTPPERLEGGPPSHAADVYALGTALAQAVSGQAPTWASASPEWHGAAVSAAAQHVLDATGDDELAELVSTMLAHDPALRPSAHQVEQTLTRLRRQLPKDALETWAAQAVPAAQAALAVRVALDVGAAADLARAELRTQEDVDTSEIEPATPVGDDDEVDERPVLPTEPLGQAPPVQDGAAAGRGEEDHRRLWEIRGPTEPGGPSRVLEWSDPSRETTDEVDRELLREDVPDPLVEDPSEVIDLGTGRFVLGADGLRAAADPDQQAELDVAVVPGQLDIDTSEDASEDASEDGFEDAFEDIGDDPSTEEHDIGLDAVAPPAPDEDRAPAPPVVPTGPSAVRDDDAGFGGGRLPPYAEHADDGQGGGWLLFAAIALILVMAGAFWLSRRPDSTPPPRDLAAQPETPPSGDGPVGPATPPAGNGPHAGTPPTSAEAAAAEAAAAEAAAAEAAAAEAAAAEAAAAEAAAAEAAAAEAAAAEAAAAEAAAARVARATTSADRTSAPAATTSRPATAPVVSPDIAPKPIPVRQAPASLAPPSTSGAAAEEAEVAEVHVEAEAEAATFGSVVLKGDAERVKLAGPAGSFSPGQEIPPGVYEITAWFGATSMESGRVTVRAGESSTITCNASFMRCSAR